MFQLIYELRKNWRGRVDGTGDIEGSSVGVAYMGVDDNFILRHLRDFRRLKAKWSRLFALNLISL